LRSLGYGWACSTYAMLATNPFYTTVNPESTITVSKKKRIIGFLIHMHV
jgi:hypothetical protein